MAIVKTTYESGAVAYEHVESLVQTGVYMFRFYGKNDFFDREVNKGDQIEVLGDKVVAYAANCPDVTIPDESEEEEFKLGPLSDHLIAMRAEEAIKEVIDNLNYKNANAEYLYLKNAECLKKSEEKMAECLSVNFDPELNRLYHNLFVTTRFGGMKEIAAASQVIADYLGDCK